MTRITPRSRTRTLRPPVVAGAASKLSTVIFLCLCAAVLYHQSSLKKTNLAIAPRMAVMTTNSNVLFSSERAQCAALFLIKNFLDQKDTGKNDIALMQGAGHTCHQLDRDVDNSDGRSVVVATSFIETCDEFALFYHAPSSSTKGQQEEKRMDEILAQVCKKGQGGNAPKNVDKSLSPKEIETLVQVMASTDKLIQEKGELTFSFGKNWQSYLETIDNTVIWENGFQFDELLGFGFFRGKNVIDVGSGSGLLSFNMYHRGVASLLSLDFDRNSVVATREMRRRMGSPDNWTVKHGSILDPVLVESFSEQFDVVYSWGVLHHTGEIWTAIDNGAKLVKPGGLLFITLYQAGPRYQEHLNLKKEYNAANNTKKEKMVWDVLKRKGLAQNEKQKQALLNPKRDPKQGPNPQQRGMNKLHDAIDWLGGLPYEVADAPEVDKLLTDKGLTKRYVHTRNEGACSFYIYTRTVRASRWARTTLDTGQRLPKTLRSNKSGGFCLHDNTKKGWEDPPF